MSEKCPRCRGAVTRPTCPACQGSGCYQKFQCVECGGTGKLYRSTAAEQLHNLKSANDAQGDLIKEINRHKERYKQQLADKEREVEQLQGKWEDDCAFINAPSLSSTLGIAKQRLPYKQEPCTQHKQFGRTFCSDCVNELVKDAQHTAAEQLAVKGMSCHQHGTSPPDDWVCPHCAKQQLADKERDIDILRKQLVRCSMKLAAANAVVEDIEALLRDDSKSGNWVCGKIAHVIAKWRKLQGGDGDGCRTTNALDGTSGEI